MFVEDSSVVVVTLRVINGEFFKSFLDDNLGGIDCGFVVNNTRFSCLFVCQEVRQCARGEGSISQGRFGQTHNCSMVDHHSVFRDFVVLNCSVEVNDSSVTVAEVSEGQREVGSLHKDEGISIDA